jgi:hypothetical protein
LVEWNDDARTPPPLGPPTYRSEKTQLGVGLLSGFVKTKVAEIITDANKKISQQTKRVTVEAMPLKVFSPRRVATLHTNRPNQYFVKLPMGISVKVKIPVTTDRLIYIPFDLNLSCEGWQTGNGTVQIVGQTGPPSIEGGNIIEEVLMVRDLINNLIRSKLTLPGAIRFSLPNSSCVTIGASRSQSVGDPFAFIAYDPAPRFRPVLDRVTQPVTVTFKKLKRLRARNNGAILEGDAKGVVEVDALIDKDVIADFQEPWSPDSCGGVESSHAGDLGAEALEQECAPSPHEPRRRAKQQCPGGAPQQSTDLVLRRKRIAEAVGVGLH